MRTRPGKLSQVGGAPACLAGTGRGSPLLTPVTRHATCTLCGNAHTTLLLPARPCLCPCLCFCPCRCLRPCPCPCRSYYWFTLALEFMALAGLTVLMIMGLLAASALSWMAWLTVLALLTIQVGAASLCPFFLFLCAEVAFCLS